MTDQKKGIIIVTYACRKEPLFIEWQIEYCYKKLNRSTQEVVNILAFNIFDEKSREIMYDHLDKYFSFFRDTIDFVIGYDNPFYSEGSDNDYDYIPDLTEYGIEVIEATHDDWDDDAYLINKYS